MATVIREAGHAYFQDLDRGAFPALHRRDGAARWLYPGRSGLQPSAAEPGPDSGAYGGLRGSFAFRHNVTTYAPPAANQLRASFANGGGGSVFVGTRLPLNLRLELEGLYRYQDISHVGVNGLTSAASGKSQTGAAMLNLFWDISVPFDSPIQPFVGMGVGGAYNVADAYDASNTYLRWNKWDLAYSFMAGLPCRWTKPRA